MKYRCPAKSPDEEGRRKGHKYRKGWHILVLMGFLSLTACGAQSGTTAGRSPMPAERLLTFAPATSYSQAVREITDLGLQPSKFCAPDEVDEDNTYTTLWSPQGQRDSYTKSHQLYVYYTMTTLHYIRDLVLPKDVIGWHAVHPVEVVPAQPLSASASAAGDYLCPFVAGALPSGASGFWRASDGWLTTSVTFTSPLDSYDTALATISNLGLGLDGPCSRPSSVGQEQAFAATHTLTVQTSTLITSTTWQEQLSHTPGVVSVASPTEHKACS